MNRMNSLWILEAIFLIMMLEQTQCLMFNIALKAAEKKSWFIWRKDSFYDEKNLFFWCSRCFKIWAMIKSFALHQKSATNRRLDWLKLKLECRIQIDRKDLCFERIELNWICDEADFWLEWSARKTREKYFYLYVTQALSELFFSFFSSCIEILMFRAAFILWENWDDVFVCMIKKTIDMMLRTSFRRILERDKN